MYRLPYKHSHVYEHARNVIYPAVLREKEKGKLRFIGTTEAAVFDLEHKMYQRALAEDDIWDTAMVAFNMMHQGTRKKLLLRRRRRRESTPFSLASTDATRPGAQWGHRSGWPCEPMTARGPTRCSRKRTRRCTTRSAQGRAAWSALGRLF